jgi:hypothetical protein
MAPSAAINEAAGRRKARQRFGRKEFAIPANPWRSRGVIDGGRDPTRPGGGYYLEPASEGLANTCVSVHVPDVEAVMRKLLGGSPRVHCRSPKSPGLGRFVWGYNTHRARTSFGSDNQVLVIRKRLHNRLRSPDTEHWEPVECMRRWRVA